jgi:hypothetical protein
MLVAAPDHPAASALPMFEVDGMNLIKLIARNGQIRKVFYTVLPRDRNSDEVVTGLRSRL